MRESVIDILFYLFDDILPETDGGEADLETMASSLHEAGYTREDVSRALNWFSALGQLSERAVNINTNALRVFSAQESYYIDDEGQDFLYGLLRYGIINQVDLELIIERALALEEPLDYETLRWVALMVVINRDEHPEDNMLASWREHWFYFDDTGTIQ